MKKNELKKITVKDKVIIPIHGIHVVKINGKDHVLKKGTGNNLYFVRMDKAKYYDRARKASEKISEKTDLVEWLTYAVMNTNLNVLQALEKELKKKKIKVKEDWGCFRLQVGKELIPLIDN